jgi:hypothetical protein
MVPCGDAERLAAVEDDRHCATMTHNPNEPHDDGGGNRRGALIGLVITVLLVVAGYYLTTMLRHQGQMQDCLM